MSEKDNYVPNGKWEFGPDVTSVFPDMIKRSIPGYSTMRETVVRVANPFLNSESSGLYFLDVGCSRGDTICEILESIDRPMQVGVTGVDSSAPMVHVAKRLFSGWDNVNFVHGDIMEIDITPNKFALITSVLTAQFIPIDARQDFYQRVHSGLSCDGGFIVVEKILGETPISQHFLVDIYHNFKRDNGYTDQQIEEKRKSLQGVLVPMTASENERMLKAAGFSNVQRFWQCLNFAGWVAFK